MQAKQLTQAKQLIQNASKTIERNTRKQKEIVRNQIVYTPHFKPYLDNLTTPLLTVPLGKSITRNRMTGTEQPDQIFLRTTEIGGSISIVKTLKADTENWKDTTIQQTIFQFKQANVPGNSDLNHFLIGSFNSGIDVTRPGRNIDNRTGVNPQGHIVTIIPESNRANNCNIFDSIRRTSYLAYRSSAWHGTLKSESEKLTRKKIENAEYKNNSKVEKVGRKNSVTWNHTGSILNWNLKYPESIHFDTNHTNSNQPITASSTNTVSINDSANIFQ